MPRLDNPKRTGGRPLLRRVVPDGFAGFGARVENARRDLNLRREDLAELVHCNYDTLRYVEHGGGLKLDLAIKIALELELPLEALTGTNTAKGES